MSRSILLFTAAIFVFSRGKEISAQNQFPEWRGKQLLLPALWDASPIVAVGTLNNVNQLGVQPVERLPRPVIQNVRRLFWCQGEFHPLSLIKGELPASDSRYVWASVNEGCMLVFGDLEFDAQRVTRIWFLRREGGILRPTFDAGSPFFYGLLVPWSNTNEPPPEKLGRLLLTPSANAQSLGNYANEIWELADVACSLLGKAECVTQIRALTRLGDPTLQTAACEYLRAQQRETCDQ